MDNTERPKFYTDGVTRVTDPLIMTKCKCGHEFWRTRKRMTVTCRKCGRIMNLK